MLRSLTLFSLIVHLASLAATQTAYGAGASMLRWLSLFALTGFGALHWLTSREPQLPLKSVNSRVAMYFGLWGLTVISAEYPLFSLYRWGAHAMIVVSALVFLSGSIRRTELPKALSVLKVIVAALLVASYLRPAHVTVFDNRGWYRGVFGNANSLGEMAAVGCLLFLHGFFTQRGTRWRYIEAMLAGLAALLMFQSAGRSSVVAFLGGFIALYILYSRRIPRYIVSGAIVIALAVAVLPSIQQKVGTFVTKHSNEYRSDLLDSLILGRQRVWERSWEGFAEHPLLGWGFGADSSANLLAWNGELTALGYARRDPVNDILYSLETGGIIGLIAYFLLVSLILRAWIPSRVRSALDGAFYRSGREDLAAAYDVQKVCCCTAILLIVLFEFDNTALSAGNFFSALLWLTLGQALGLSRMLRAVTEPAAPPQYAAAVLAA